MPLSFYSTNNPYVRASLRDAALQGLASDGGLFMPSTIPRLPENFFHTLPSKCGFTELAWRVGKILFDQTIPDDVLETIIRKSLTFEIPLVCIPSPAHTYTLELFHGPTLSFKDVGARFMAQLMSYFIQDERRELTILVATSGDTGSAVASGFYNISGVRVYILYPSGKVSDIQEKQLTTYGGNITALEIDGTFDDCQHLVKQAFQDTALRSALLLASANSINIARLFPQSFYYAYAYAQSLQHNTAGLPVVISVPSGNFGNLTAGLIAKRMGTPISQFIASTNINDVVPIYLKSGVFTPRASHHTISNAMDVGNPSNFTRMLELYKNSAEAMRNDIWSTSCTDDQTRMTMKWVYEQTGYILDPHGAVGYCGLQKYREQTKQNVFGVCVETAHPAKFFDTVYETLGVHPDMPERLNTVLQKQKGSIPLSNTFKHLKEYLLTHT